MSCLSFNREIYTADLDGERLQRLELPSANSTPGITEDDYRADALLYNQLRAATGNATLTSEIQFAIWSIMDRPDINASNSSYTNLGAFDTVAQTAGRKCHHRRCTCTRQRPSREMKYSFPSGSRPQRWYASDFMTDPVPSAVRRSQPV